MTTELGAKCKLRETVVDGIFVSVPVGLVRTNEIRPQTGSEFRRVHPFPGSPPVTQAKSPEPEAPERRRGLPPPVSLLQDLAVTERALRCRPRLRDTCQRPPRSPPQVCGGTSSTDLTGRKPAQSKKLTSTPSPVPQTRGPVRSQSPFGFLVRPPDGP